MDVQVFTPQEYIAGCYRWKLELECTGGSTSGDHYVLIQIIVRMIILL